MLMKDKFSKFINLQGKYLTSLLILLALSIGQMWAADEVVVIGSQSSGSLTIATNTHSVAGISGGTNTNTIADASDGQSASGGSKMGGTSEIGSKLSSKSKQHIRFTVAAGETVRFYYYQTGGADKASTFATSDFSQSAAYYHAATEYVAAAKNALYYVDFVFADAGTYAISLTTGQSVYMAALKFTAAGGGGDDTTPPTLSSSTPANSATGVNIGGNIVLTFSESVSINDASKFTLSGGTLNTAGAKVSGANVSIPYSGLSFGTEYTLSVAAEAVKDASNNKSAALDDIVFTTKLEPTTFSTSINIEQLVLDNGTSYNIGAALDAAHIAYVDKDALDSLKDQSGRNEPFLGLKFKKATSKVTIIVPANEYLKVKFGSIASDAGLKVSVNGSAAAAPTVTSGVYTLAASTGAQEVVFTQTAAKTVVYKQIKINEEISAVTLPWLVTYDKGAHGECATASEVWKGTALTLPAVTPESGWDFDGWSDGENLHAAGASFTPTANVTLTAQYTAQASGTDLDALTYQIGTGSPVAVGYSAGTFTYNIELPYAVYPTITVAVTPVSGASIVDDVTKILTVSSLPGTATFTVTDGVDDQLYTVNFTRAPKDGVSIIKATINSSTKNTIGEVTGLYKKEASTGGLSDYKFNGKGAYIGLTLEDGQTFDEGDIINVHTTTASGQGTIALYDDHGNDVTPFYDYGVMGGLGDNKFALPAAADTRSTIYVCRTNANTWNGYVDFIEVTRAMNPVLTAITINGEAGVIDESLKTVSVELQPGYDLAALTIVPTIVSNTPQADVVKTVTTNSGNWIIGDNTYRLTDKDGDYTEYTVTLVAGSLKYDVTFNTHGGSTVDAVKVVDGEHLAAAPTAPTKEDYIFQYWSLTDGGAEVDVTSIVIDKDTTFHAVWASDGAIKLLDGSTVNTTNFITGVTASTVEIESVEHNCVTFAGTVGSSVNSSNMKYPNREIAYNATKTQTKIKLSLYNSNSSNKRTIYVQGVIEGQTSTDDIVNLATIELNGGEQKTTEWLEFNNAANRTIYIFVSSNAGDIKILQTKVLESGDALKMAGEVGYSINLNKGRWFGAKETNLAFEGMAFNMAGDYTPLASTVAKFKSKSIVFDVAAPVSMSVTAANDKTYYVTKGAAGTDNETAKTGESIFDLTAGTWYITAGGSEVQFTGIEFAQPRCEAPVFGSLADIELCTGEVIPAIDGTATVSDDGDVTYKWYQEGSETVLATTATYTPAADGSYFVVATNSLAGHQDVSTTSVVVKVAHFASVAITTAPEDVYKHAGLDAELSVVAEGKNVEYEWFTCDDELGTNPVAFDPAETGASLNLTAIETGIKYYQVVVTDECGTSASAVAKVEGFNDIALVDVTGDMSWDFSKASDGTTATSSMCNEAVLVNVPGIVNNSDFESDNIMATANKFSSGKLQASMIKFHSTVDGVIKVVFSNTGDKSDYRYLVVNGVQTDMGSKNGTALTYYGFVPAGDVVLTVTTANGGNMFNFTSVKFIAKNAVDFARDAAHGDDWMAPGELGTICLEHGSVATGGDVFTLECKNTAGKIVFASVSHMEPGKPYLFQAKSNAMNFYYTDEAEVSEPDNSGAMKGSFSDYTLNEVANVYYFAGHALWLVDADHLDVIAHRAYVKMDEVVVNEPAPMPGRRYITMNVNGEQTATAIDNLNASEEPVKLLIDGQLFILRGEKMFDATGRLVK